MNHLPIVLLITFIASVNCIIASNDSVYQVPADYVHFSDGCYNNEAGAREFHNQIKAIVNIPSHMQTKNIIACIELAKALDQNIKNGTNMHMIKDETTELYSMSLKIKNDQEYKAYQKVILSRQYTQTNLVELEQQRNNQSQHRATRSPRVTTGCNCTIN